MDYFINFEKTLSEWKKFISTKKDIPTEMPIIIELNKRNHELGLETNELKFNILSKEELDNKIEEYEQLLEASDIHMDNLSMSLNGIQHIIALSDKDGWIINLRGTIDEFGGKNVEFCKGACWSENYVGCNGIGTCLALKQPVFIYKDERSIIYNSLAYIGTPITYENRVIGALSISLPIELAHPGKFCILVASVCSIAEKLKISNINFNKNLSDMNLSDSSEIISTIVHDLKNPLAVISGLSQLGRITKDKHTINNYFERIYSQTEEMNNMVIELLSIFKPVNLYPQNIFYIIEDVLLSYKPICDLKNIKLSCLHDENTSVICNVSENLFRRAIENLINNAVQLIDKGGFIELQIKLEKDFIIISITDTAGGIPDEIKETLFEPFSFRRSGGTGLGLFMAYHTITYTHKGQIWFETEPGIGSTFFIKLPRVSNS